MENPAKDAVSDTQFQDQETQDILESVRPLYAMVRVLPDGSIAGLHDLLYTRAVFLGVNLYGWTKRYCFEDRALATRRFHELASEDDIPEGYTARRGS